MQVEHGETVKAYQSGEALLARHPENANVHFALSYVLRYGGAIEESAHECDAMSMDPGSYGFRSCAFTFDQLGNYARAVEFLQLDVGSEWSLDNLMRHQIRDGKLAQAKAMAQKLNARTMQACLADQSPSNTAGLVRETAAAVLADPDPEVRYVVAEDVLFCAQKDLALRMLKSSVDGHFCAYTGLQNDSMWAKLRGTQEFAELLSAGKKCRDDFMAKRTTGSIGLPTRVRVGHDLSRADQTAVVSPALASGRS
jgi:hypothetical protein